MTALHEVAAYRPPSVPIDDLADRLGLEPLQVKVFRRLHGLGAVRVAEFGWARSLLAAAGGLETLEPERVRYVIAARTVVPCEEPFPLDEVCDKLGLSHAVRFVLADHACASGLLAVDVAGKLLAAAGDPRALALVLTGELASDPQVRLIPDTTIMGEATAACLVSAGGDRDRLLAYASRPLARDAPPDAYPETLAEVLAETVARAGVGWDDVAVVLPHNVNRVLWVRVARSLGLPDDRVWLRAVPTDGHCFSADTFLNYLDARSAGSLHEGQVYLMAAAGKGAVASAMAFRH